MSRKIKIQGEVVGRNSIQYAGRIVNCWVTDVDDAKKIQPLDISLHEKDVVELEGVLYNDLWNAKFKRKLYRANEAKSLNDLLQIRAVKRDVIEKIDGYLGSALGYKWCMNKNTKHPCVIIFVLEKKPLECVLEEDTVIAPTILEHNGKWCFTDVLRGKINTSCKLPPVDNNNEEIVEELESGKIGLIGGIKLLYKEGNKKNFATAGIVVKGQTGEHDKGFLVNRHITSRKKRDFYNPDYNASSKVATYEKPMGVLPENLPFLDWYETSDEPKGVIEPDFAYLKISDEILKKGTPKVKAGLHRIGDVGPIKSIDKNTMDIIGQKVISVGCRRGMQRGVVIAFSYEYIDSKNHENYYIDLLIKGEKSSEFSDRGDSGKIIVTDDEEHRPIGLHVGGWQGYLHKNAEIEKFGYALELKRVLDNLKLEIYKE